MNLMKDKIINYIVVSTFVIFLLSVGNYYSKLSQSESDIYAKLGSSTEKINVDTKEIFNEFNLHNDYDSSALYKVIYLTSASECKNSIVEIRELSTALKNLRKDINAPKVEELVVLVGNDINEVKSELHLISTEFNTSYVNNGPKLKDILDLGNDELVYNQLIFIYKEEITFRNKLSNTLDVSMEARLGVIKKGLEYIIPSKILIK